MMNMKFYLWLVALGVLTSCVDDKYKLDKIDTDDILVGDEWVFPLGTVDVKVTDVIDLDGEKVKELRIAENGDYSALYEDFVGFTLPPNFSGNQGAAGVDIKEVVPTITFKVDDLNNLTKELGNNFSLGLVDPHILLEATGLEGLGTVNASFDLTTTKNATNSGRPLDISFDLSKSKPNIWIGPRDPKGDKYTYVSQSELPSRIAALPDRIVLQATKFVVPMGQITAITGLKYSLDLPFVPSAAFNAAAIQSMKDIFDGSMLDYIFSSGSTTIFGTVDNELPFDVKITMYITNASGNTLLMLPEQEVKGTGKRPVSFEITEEDMPKMKNARNIKLEFELKGRADNATFLNANQTMKMELKLRKKGGIKVEA